MEKELIRIEPKSISMLVAIIFFIVKFPIAMVKFAYIYVGLWFHYHDSLDLKNFATFIGGELIYIPLAFICVYIICCIYNWVAKRIGGIKYHCR